MIEVIVALVVLALVIGFCAKYQVVIIPRHAQRTWWVGDGDGNGTVTHAHTAQEAIATVAQETFDLRAELVGDGIIE